MENNIRTKANISNDYLTRQRIIHGDKIWNPWNRRAIFTGANRVGSIGKAIIDGIVWQMAYDSMLDVRGDAWEFSLPNFSSNWNILVCCHGVTKLSWFEDLNMEKAKEIVDVNLFGTINVINSFVKMTINSKERKRIFIIGSMAHRSVLNGSAVYCASKAGVNMLARCLAWELAPKGFDVFCIHPSNVEGTPMTEETINGLMCYRGLSRVEAESYWNDSPIRDKILQTTDIVKLVRFLLKHEAAYLSGCPLELGGGQR